MIEQPLLLPCGHQLPNRLCKASMTEGLADPRDRPTPAHQRLYASWARGGAALLLTGNIMIDRRYLERAGNVVIEHAAVLPELRAWVESVHQNGSQLWAQISHPGRQCPRMVNLQPVAPSPVQLDLLGNFGKPRALEEPEILEIIERFATTAALVMEGGFDGVQIHAAHGYLLSQFLSPRTNLRTDQWGGSLENRARLLLKVIEAVRARVGATFPVAVKLNSSDFVKGGFTLEECLQVVRWLNQAGIDLLEISGGTYEQVEFFRAVRDSEVRASTRQREALFLEYASSIKEVASMPVMVTGGFRTRAGMEAALADNQTDLIGLARPFCVDPDFPRRLMANEIDTLPVDERHLALGSGFWGANSSLSALRGLNNQAHAGWYYHQIELLGQGLAPDPAFSPLRALFGHLGHDAARSMRRKWS